MNDKNINRIVYCFNYASAIHLIAEENLIKENCIIITHNTGLEKIREKLVGLEGYTVVHRENYTDSFTANSYIDIIEKL